MTTGKTLHMHGRQTRPRSDARVLVMRDLVDQQIETADGWDIGRVDDVEAEIGEDGVARLTALLAGPQALVGRLSSRLRPLVRRILRDRFDSRIPIGEVAELGLTIKLRGNADEYRLGASERWLAAHLVGRMPGGRRRSGRNGAGS